MKRIIQLKPLIHSKELKVLASSFDSQTLSAVAWLIANNIDISCFELSFMKIGDNYFIDINRILHPPDLENFYVKVDDKKKSAYSEKNNTPITRTYLPRMDKLFEWRVIKAGYTIELRILRIQTLQLLILNLWIIMDRNLRLINGDKK